MTAAIIETTPPSGIVHPNPRWLRERMVKKLTHLNAVQLHGHHRDLHVISRLPRWVCVDVTDLQAQPTFDGVSPIIDKHSKQCIE